MTPPEQPKRVLVVGQVFVDSHFDCKLIRLGGIFHVARALDALRIDYASGFICPSYLDRDCENYFSRLNARAHRKIGNVSGAPNVMQIGHSAEAGDQDYRDVLRESRRVELDLLAFEDLANTYRPTDILVTGDAYDGQLIPGLIKLGARIHVDTDHDYSNVWVKAKNLTTIFCSTSGSSFHRSKKDPSTLKASWSAAEQAILVLKENRGGSRAWNLGRDEPPIGSPAYPTATTHSVGVGDCFNGVWVAIGEKESLGSRARVASHIASIYASTFDHAAFVKDVRTAESVKAEILELRGVRLPWERRPELNIYLAAPDFPYIDTERLERLSEALRYHNFSGHRPIQENGLAESSMSRNERRSIYSKDMELLATCNLLIATPLTEDPGTYAELGLFSAEGKPTILYDPHRKVTNTFVLNTASRVCFTITEVIDSVFELLGRQYGE